jgi:hypothetical protein
MLGHGASFFETRMARDRGETDEAPPTIRLGYRCIALPGGGAALRGAVVFMGCAQEGWTLGDLVGWFDEHLVSPERMKRPRAFHEHGVPPVPAPPRADPRASVERITRTDPGRPLLAGGHPREADAARAGEGPTAMDRDAARDRCLERHRAQPLRGRHPVRAHLLPRAPLHLPELRPRLHRVTGRRRGAPLLAVQREGLVRPELPCQAG